MMKKDTLNDLADSLIKHGNPHLPKEGFDRDKWQWDDATRMNEQEKRITRLIEESNQHKRAIISLSKKVEHLLGQSRWDLREFAKKALLDDVVEKFDDPDRWPHLDEKSAHWVREKFHEEESNE
tara:strand:+ start:198 stop:569 length:372 start_codon:yes stop_codon:yes gene_type:complete